MTISSERVRTLRVQDCIRRINRQITPLRNFVHGRHPYTSFLGCLKWNKEHPEGKDENGKDKSFDEWQAWVNHYNKLCKERIAQLESRIEKVQSIKVSSN